jgi:hypothetical protein
VTSRLPHGVLGALSTSIAVTLYGAAALASKASWMPYGTYLRYLRRYPFRYMSHIVYDHLVPRIAHYIPRHELEAWVAGRGMDFQISSRNGNSWRLLASKPAAAVQGGPVGCTGTS